MTLDDYEIDGDYIDVESKRADVTTNYEDDESADDTSDASESCSEDADGRGTYTQGGGDRTYRFDTGIGSGGSSAVDDLIDQDAVFENDGRSQTRTFFYADDDDYMTSEQKRQYRRLAKLNDGWRSPERKQQNSRADKRRWTSAFCGHLGIGGQIADRIEAIVMDINMGHMAHYRTETVILAVISKITEEHGRFIRDEDEFKRLVSDVDTNLGRITKARRLADEKTDML